MTIIGIDPGQGGAIACWNKGIKSYKCPQNVDLPVSTCPIITNFFIYR